MDFIDGKRVWLPVGAGQIDYEAHLHALQHDNYNGGIALETHFRLPGDNGIKSTKKSYEGLMQILHSIKQN